MVEIVEEIPSVGDFLRLRRISGLSPRPRDAAERGLPNSLYAVQIRIEGETIGMGRIVGDGGLNYEIVDVAVDTAHQGKGLGRAVMERLMAYLEREAPKGAYVSLVGDVPALYEKFGFRLTRPGGEGMYWIR